MSNGQEKNMVTVKMTILLPAIQSSVAYTHIVATIMTGKYGQIRGTTMSTLGLITPKLLYEEETLKFAKTQKVLVTYFG